MMTPQVEFDFNEKVALTVNEEGEISYWTDSGLGVSKVFSNGENKAVLHQVDYWIFEGASSSATYCDYLLMWFGDYPYGSWAYTIKKCKITKEVTIGEVSTDINSRGMTSADKFVQRCKAYVPESIKADFTAS